MKRILVVEDSLTVQSTLKRLLGREGYEVGTASDGLSAFAMLDTFKPQLIMLDIGLPGVGGIELCVAIRRTPDFANTPIIMATGSHKLVDVRLAHEFGANAYITKPFDEVELVMTIESLLSVPSDIPPIEGVAL